MGFLVELLRYNNNTIDRVLFFLATILFFITCVIIAIPFAENTPLAEDASLATEPNAEKEKIHITADRLISDSKQKNAEFIGNVKVIQGTNVITADRFKIFYKKRVDNSDDMIAGEGSIDKIAANGNVVIKFENKVAESDQAVYHTNTQVIVLTGENSKVTSGENSVSGKKITLYRIDGRMIVESGPEERVKAIFYSEKSEKETETKDTETKN